MIENSKVISRAGIFSSMTAGVCTLLFGLLIIAGFTFDTIKLQFAVCLVLAIAYTILVNALYSFAPEDKKIWGRITVSFAVIYSVYICLTYYSQLTVVNLGLVSNENLDLIRYMPGSWIFAVDMLGYSFLALSTLSASFLFGGTGLERWIRVLMIIHGALAVPTFLFPMLPLFGSAESVQSASLGGAFALLAWCLLFAPICFLLVRYFKLGRIHLSSAQESASI